jgi:hypothetical protein
MAPKNNWDMYNERGGGGELIKVSGTAWLKKILTII